MAAETVAEGQGTGGEVTVVTPPTQAGPSPRELRAAKIATAAAVIRRAPEATTAQSAPVLEVKAEEKPAELAPEVDPQTAKGIEAIEKRDKRAREQLAKDQAAWKQQMEMERADIARIRAEAAGKPIPSLDELKKLPVAARLREAMKLVDLDPDNEEHAEVASRDLYARSKSGKADPKNRAFADQIAEKSALEAQLADMRKMIEETRSTLTEREQKAQLEQFQNKWLDDAAKALPAEPSLVSLAMTKSPERTRSVLLDIGKRMEVENGETPTHAEVIAEYEAIAKADLQDRGFTDAQIAAMLKPNAAPAPAIKQVTRTLDPSAGPTTAPVSPVTTREQKVALARAGIRKLQATT